MLVLNLDNFRFGGRHGLNIVLKNSIILFLIAALFCGIFNCAPQAVLASEESKDEPTKIAIANFGIVSESIWRGSVPSQDGLNQLANNGVRTIIDLRMNSISCQKEENAAKKLGLKYIHLPLGFKSPSYNNVTEFLKIVSNPLNLPVYIHCHQGADRTGTLVGIYRIIVENWTFDHAYNEMRLHHFKPWLFSMKRSVIAVSKNDSVRQVLQTAIDNAHVTIFDSSETTELRHAS